MTRYNLDITVLVVHYKALKLPSQGLISGTVIRYSQENKCEHVLYSLLITMSIKRNIKIRVSVSMTVQSPALIYIIYITQ
jgi:hypothetical protein